MKILKTGLTWVMGALIAVGISQFTVAQEQTQTKGEKQIAWYDMEHCELCKNFASMKDQMHRMRCETKVIDDGLIMVAFVPRNMKEAMDAAEKNMEKTVARLTQGEQLPMCGFCQGYGELMELGAKFQNMEVAGNDVTIVTSEDEEVVKKIQEFARQAQSEHEKMMAELKKKAPKKNKNQ